MARSQRQSGFSLLELAIVLLILGLVAAAIPSLSSSDESTIDAAAAEVAAALRFARAESIRTGAVHGVEVNLGTQQITVYKADLATNPLSQDYVLHHPVDKHLYQFVLADRPNLARVLISNGLPPFDFAGFGRRDDLIFDAAGTPKWIAIGTSTTYQLADGAVQLKLGSAERNVTIESETGRVAVQ